MSILGVSDKVISSCPVIKTIPINIKLVLNYSYKYLFKF